MERHQADADEQVTRLCLTAFGFFFSRLLLFWPFATASSYGFWSPGSDRFHDPYASTARNGFNADSIMWLEMSPCRT
jgi:hypothetical protein